MKQVMITRRGGGEVLQVVETPVHEPGPGQVRIRVQAAGVNFADVMMRLGVYPDGPKLPAVPGYEVAGVVDAVGPGADPGLEGRPVVAMCRFGGYSESVCVPGALVFPLPEGVGSVTAAALPVNYLTAWQMVRVMAPAGPGDVVLIHSAAGGVGQAVIQLCQAAGAKVIGSASPGKHDLLSQQGLEYVFDSRQRNFAEGVKAATGGRGADIVLEPRNGPWIMESYRSLAKCGRLVVFGFSHAAVGRRTGTLSVLRTVMSVPWFQLNPLRLMNDNKSVAGVNLGRMWDQADRTRSWAEELVKLMGAGIIAPRIDGVFPFSAAAAAHARLEDRVNVGKVILVPDEGNIA